MTHKHPLPPSGNCLFDSDAQTPPTLLYSTQVHPCFNTPFPNKQPTSFIPLQEFVIVYWISVVQYLKQSAISPKLLGYLRNPMIFNRERSAFDLSNDNPNTPISQVMTDQSDLLYL